MNLEPVSTVVEMLRNLKKCSPNPKALNDYENGHWNSISTDEIFEQIRYISQALFNLGIKKGDRIGIVSVPSARWVIVDLAIMLVGGISVPLFANISEENFVFEVIQTELKTIFVAGDEPWNICKKYQHNFDTIIDLDKERKETLGIPYSALLEDGRRLNIEQPNLFHSLENEIHPDDVATVIYTSGSTGTPKGAVITQKTFVCCIYFDGFKWNRGERYLNILPLAHVFGRMLNLAIFSRGISIYYFTDAKNFAMACKDVHPSVLVVVPRVLEKIYAKMASVVQQTTGLKKGLIEWAFELAHLKEHTPFQRLMLPILDHLVYKKFRAGLGGEIRIVISGGAPLNTRIHYFFLNIGIPVYEGWGMTEAATVTVNRPLKNKPGSVGIPVPQSEIKTSPEGEVLVKGPLVMREYYKNPTETAKALDSEGWLHSGDKGFIDDDGYLTLIGRIKEVYKTSTGEYVVPVPIEQSLCRSPFIDMAMVIADQQKFASCLFFPDLDYVHRIKKERRQDKLSDEEFLKDPKIKKEIDDFIKDVNQHLNHWEQIHQYRFVLIPLSIEEGELTPSMKIKRDFVANKYRHLIDNMYAEESS